VQILSVFEVLDPDSLRTCIEILRNGGIVCYPTETFYALGIDPANEEALSKLYRLKNRPPEKELPLIASDMPMVSTICDTGDSRFVVLARKYWPGPLTLVLPSLDGSRTYAVRVSSNSVARQIAEGFGAPIVATSANRSGDPPVQNPRLLPETLSDGLDLLIDSGASPGGEPSTIVSLTAQPGKILREGAIPAYEIVSLL
jgi:L-threonylcarbamoyladenylate synthase